ncbi:beta strand repeat-containing protein [uncultured Polaribacter sp.]|uniref:beta strand repeat-containing protein n=1 Tax=uncultured Polaribacter sp. TaxID=174711 RepID=UPI0037049BD4
MKKIVLILLFFGTISYGQTKGISYQALILDPVVQELPGFNNELAPLANKTICLKFSILDELSSLEYEEIFTTTTDDVGMVNLIIGNGTNTGGYASSFEDIVWSTLAKNLSVDLSVKGNCTDYENISIAPFTAVPFALFAVNTQDTPLVLENEAEIILLKALLAATQTGAGLNTDGTYTPDASTNYISSITSLKEADTALDSQVKNNEDAITINTSDIAANIAAVANNTININTNTIDIAANSTNITTNTTGIADNTTAINERVKIVDIINDLTTGGTMQPLSAEQGKVLKDLVDNSVTIAVENNLTSTSTTNALSANQGRVLTALIDTNSSDITTNISNIATNATDITTNTNNIALKEDAANKSTDATLAGNSDVKFPTEKAIKTYVDTATDLNATNANLTGMVTSVGNATTVVTNADLTGMVTSAGNATSLGSFTSANLSGAVTDETGTGSAVFATSPTLVTPALGTPSALVGTNITGTASSLTAGNVTTNANLTGEVTSIGNATTLTNSAVIGKVLTGFTSGAGTISATDNILQAVQKLDGNNATNADLTGMVTSSGNATTVVTNADLTGEVTSSGNATTLTNSAVIGKVLTGFTSGAGTISATDNILQAVQKLDGNNATNADLTGMVTSSGNATTVVTNADLTGEVTSSGNATTLTNSAVIGKVLTGFTSGAGTISATDNILQAVQKLDGNNATNADLTGMVTSSGNATTVVTNADLTGEVTSSGNATTLTNSAVIGKVLTGFTSGAGTISATDNILQAVQKLDGNNATNADLTGMVTSSGNATTVVTNADLTGEVTSSGNATTLTNSAVIGKVLTGFTSGAGTISATDNILQAVQKLDGNNATNADLTGMVTSSGNATTVVTNADLTGEVTSSGNATTLTNSAVIGKVLTGFTSGAGTISATDNILQAVQKLDGNNATNADLTGMVTSSGNATTVVTNADLTGEVTSSGNATTLTNSAVIGKVLTGFTSGAGTISATDNILQAVQKLDGNNATNADLTGMVTSSGNATTVVTNADLTGEVTSSGNATTLTNSAVIGKVLTGFTSGAGTISATDNILQAVQKLDGNNATNADLTGMVTSSGNATTVVTNADLTGEVTSSGNATTLTNSAVIGKVLTGFTSGAGTISATDNILQAVQKLDGNNATNADLTGMVTSSGNATTVVTNADLTGEVTSSGNATTLTNSAVIGKVLTGFTSGAGTISATDNILQAVQKLDGNNATNADLTGMVTSSGNATTVVTNADLTGEVTSSGNATTLTNSAVIGKVLTGFTSGAGTISATDNILQAVQKLDGNNATNADLTGMVTSSGNATTVVTNADLTGEVTSSGNATTLTNSAVIGKVLTGFTSGAGTISATDNILQAVQKLDGNNATNADLTGMVTSSGNATTVVTNADLTGEVTSSGNATTLTNSAVIGKVLTGFTSGAGTISATDNILQAVQKLDGNNATNADLTGMVTSSGNATTVVTNADLTGEVTSSGNATTLTNSAVIGKVLTGFTSGAGTISATDNILQAVQKLDGNNATNADLTGMVTSSGNATTVVTNADLTGEVTSSGNATTLTNSAVIGKVLTGFTSGGWYY